MSLTSFDHQPRTRLVFGNGTLARVGELASELGCKRALVVSDPGITRAGYPARAVELLNKAGLQAQVFSEVHENPSTLDVDRCVDAAREFRADLIIGLGGGSSMDTAKGCNFILTNGGRMQDYWGVGKAKLPMLPMIAVPTTSGTGSECQSFALISDAETHVKMACGDPKAAARIAVCTGIDALSHAIESAVTSTRTPISAIYSREAFRLLNEGFSRVLREPTCLQARGQMLLGAALAGTAIECSMLGAAHSCANPLTAFFKVVHGEAVGVMLPHVIRFNSELPAVAALYTSYYDGDLADRVSELLAEAQMPRSISSYGVTEKDIPALAGMATKQWTATFNPRPVSETDFADLFAAALKSP
jgi:alcohol dehydrogenase